MMNNDKEKKKEHIGLIETVPISIFSRATQREAITIK